MMRPILRSALTLLALGALACGDAGEEAPSAEGVPSVAPAGDTLAAEAPSDQVLNPNEATREELLATGMSEPAADALLAGRPYEDMLEVDAMLAAHGMDEAGREDLYSQLWLPLDLNNATGEEILLIPGVGERMEHEFEEYRPYRAIEEFRREIGKYVDEEEVARLERYVEIR